MAQKIIKLGTTAKDGTGTDLREGGGYINDNFKELYAQANRMLDLTAFVVSDTDDKYAHESQILIHQLGDKTVLLVMYTSDKVTSNERLLTAHALLKVYELTTKTHLKTLDMFAPGMEAGVTMEADESITAPRMYITGDTLMCFCGNESTLYHRTVDMTGDDPSAWTASNISIFQMTMKNAAGEDVLANVTSANVQIHLEYVLGDSYAGYTGLAPWFRNLDRIAIHGTDWYSILELSDELGARLSNIAMLIKSTDSGVSWSFISPIAYTTLSRQKVIESSAVFIGDVIHVIYRLAGNYVGHVHSDDYGATWEADGNLIALTTKPTAINYHKHSGATGVLIAYNLISEIDGNTYRTTLAIYDTDDLFNLIEIAKIVSDSYAHYPSLCHFSRALYMSYSKGLKYFTDEDTNLHYNRNTIVVARIY